MSEAKITMVAVKAVRAGQNVREHFDPKGIEELAANIKAEGLHQPPVVRPLPKYTLHEPDLTSNNWRIVLHGNGKIATQVVEEFPKSGEKGARAEYAKLTKDGAEYELIMGERRHRAIQVLGWKEMPVIVREVDDAAAFKAQMSENLQRESLSAVEEANGYKRAIEQFGMTKEALAKEFGKSRSHVFARLRLATLDPKVKAALAQEGIPDSIAELVATIPETAQQLKAIKRIASAEWSTELNRYTCMTARAAKEYIDREYRKDLKAAKFDLKQKDLVPGVPTCDECPKRSGNLDPETKSPNVCTDPACLGRKNNAFISRTLDKYRDEGCEVLPASKTRELFWYGNDLKDGRGYVKPNDVIEGDKKGRTYAQVLKGSDVKPVVALDLDGKPTKLIPVEAAKPVLKEKGVKAPQQEQPQSYRETPEQKAKREAREKLATAGDIALAGEIAKRVSAPTLSVAVELAIWRCILNVQLDYGELPDAFFTRRGLKENQNFTKKDLEKLSAAELRGMAVETFLTEWGGYEDYKMEPFVEALKLDANKIRAQARAAVEAEQKALEQKAAKGAKAEEKKPAKHAKDAKKKKGKK